MPSGGGALSCSSVSRYFHADSSGCARTPSITRLYASPTSVPTAKMWVLLPFGGFIMFIQALTTRVGTDAAAGVTTIVETSFHIASRLRRVIVLSRSALCSPPS